MDKFGLNIKFVNNIERMNMITFCDEKKLKLYKIFNPNLSIQELPQNTLYFVILTNNIVVCGIHK